MSTDEPCAIRSPPTLKIVIRSSRGFVRPIGMSPMCAAAFSRKGRCASDALTTVQNGPYPSSTNGSRIVSSVLMWFAR